MAIDDKVREFVTDKLDWDGRQELTEDFPLIEAKVVGSTGIFKTSPS